MQFSASGTVTLTLPTAASMIAAMPDPDIGSIFFGKLLNNNYNSRGIQIASNGTFTYKGATTISVGQSANYVVRVWNVASPSLIMYN
jgi:hypothetical protein